MPTRYKILILLIAITVVLGALTLSRSGNDADAVLRFRSLFSIHTLYDLKPLLTPITDRTSLWYGGISLFAIIMIVLIFRAARVNGSQRSSARLIELKPAKARAGNVSHDEMLKDSPTRHANDGAVQNLEISARRIRALENDLREKEELLQNRDGELNTLRFRVATPTDPPSETVLGKAENERVLREELERMTELQQAKDANTTELKNSLAEKQQLLQSQSQELDALKSRVNSLTEQQTDLRLAKERAENVLQRELKKKALQAKDATVEDGLNGTVHALERQLVEKQELLQTRSKELKAAKSKVNTLRDRLSSLGSTKKQTESALQQQLKQKTELLQSKETAIKELQENLNAKVHALEEQLKDRDAKPEGPESEANATAESGFSREQAKGLLLQELQNRTELLQTKDAMVKELEERLNATVHALENAQRELETLEKQRNAVLLDPPTKIAPAKEQAEGWPRPERKGMNSKLLELGAAKARAAASFPAEEAKPSSEINDSSIKESREVSGGALDQDGEKDV